MNRAHSLLELQKLDRALDAIGSRLRTITAQMAADPELATAQAEVAGAQESLSELERRLRTVSDERAALKTRIAAEEAKLYGGRVQAPKELQALEREVASLRRRLAVLDDQSLALMLDRDAAAERLEAALARRGDKERAAGETTERLAAERGELEGKRRVVDHRRGAVAEGIDPTAVAAYEKVRRTRHGVGVAQVGADGCAACGCQLPRSTVEKVRATDELVRCPGCGRILAG
jgi:predicted  nucleic acid-binding Zn-ribbon protein